MTVLTGVVLCLTGSTLINIGTNIVKMSHESLVQYRPKTMWRLGTVIFVIGNLLNFASFGFAAQSLLSGLGSIQFVVHIVFAHFISKQAVGRKALLGTLSIIVGNSLLVKYGSRESQYYTTSELIDLCGETSFLVYFFTTICVALFLTGLYYYLWERIGDTGSSLLPVSYATVSASVGTYSVLLSKSLSTVLPRKNQLDDPVFYAILFIWLGAMSFWLYRMNTALRLFRGHITIPVHQVLWIVFSVTSGGIFFQEFFSFSTNQTFGFVSGLLFILAGVAGLSEDANIDEGSIISATFKHTVNDPTRLKSTSTNCPTVSIGVSE